MPSLAWLVDEGISFWFVRADGYERLRKLWSLYSHGSLRVKNEPDIGIIEGKALQKQIEL